MPKKDSRVDFLHGSKYDFFTVQFSENFKSGYKDLVGRWFFSALRQGERRFSRQTFYSTLKSFFFLRAWVNCAFRKCGHATPRPEFLRLADPARAERQQRANDYLNHVLEFFPERLADEKWKGYCRVEGLEHWQSARQNGRPVVLAFCHFGAYLVLRCLLRSAGIPAATLVGVKRNEIPPLKRLKDWLEPFHDVPLRFFEHQFRGADEFLAAGNTLLIGIDVPSGMQIDVPLCEGWTFQMSASSVRFAIRRQADLIPCTIVDEGRWRFSIKFGRPVPRELLPEQSGWLPAEKHSWIPAGKHLLEEMLPVFRAHPEQCRLDFVRRLRKDNITAFPAESSDECQNHAEDRLAR